MSPHQSPDPAVREYSVRDYYEQNSAWFRWVSRYRYNQAIHRPVWAQGVENRTDALNYVNACIAARLQTTAPAQSGERIYLADLGCGFGGTIQYLLRRFGSQVFAVGITLSPQQAQTGLAGLAGLGDRLGPWASTRGAILEGDFHTIPLAHNSIDMAYSIEAFAHAADPARYFAEAARILKPGGRLILCDDFRAAEQAGTTQTGQPDDIAARWQKVFQTGWHIAHLLTPAQVNAVAQAVGLRSLDEINFSPWLRIRTFSDGLLPLFERITGAQNQNPPPLPGASFLAGVVGGWALEHCIRRGMIDYRFLVFEKTA